MQRRSFIKQSVLWTAGCAVGSRMSLWGTVSAADEVKGTVLRSGELYKSVSYTHLTLPTILLV